MTIVTPDQIDMAVPDARYEDILKYVEFLNEGMEHYQINTPDRVCAFIAQVAHECADFRRVEENLNYSWQGLRNTWPTRFPTAEFAQQYHRQKEKIANYVYANRFGNGNEASGDGWRFRGRGLIQTTFHDNYKAYAEAIGDASIISEPSLLAQPRHAALSACYYWSTKGLNALADIGTEVAFNKITNKINGKDVGKLSRLDNWIEARKVLAA